MNEETTNTDSKVKSILRDTHKKITFEFHASRKLTREEMMVQLRYFYYNPNRDRPKSGGRVIIQTDI